VPNLVGFPRSRLQIRIILRDISEPIGGIVILVLEEVANMKRDCQVDAAEPTYFADAFAVSPKPSSDEACYNIPVVPIDACGRPLSSLLFGQC
jgi:hypothetical protein